MKVRMFVFLKVGTHAGRYEWLIGSIYMNCEGVRRDENVLKMLRVKDVVRKAKDQGLKIMIGGDMNAHIWKLDKYENKNGKLLKNMVNEMNWLQTTQPISGGAVTADSNCCANCVEPPRPHQWGPDLPVFWACHADPLDGWRYCSQKRAMSRPIQVRQH